MSYFYDVTGTWFEHDTHGWQFIVSDWERATPTTRKTHDWMDMPPHQAAEKPTGKQQRRSMTATFGTSSNDNEH